MANATALGVRACERGGNSWADNPYKRRKQREEFFDGFWGEWRARAAKYMSWVKSLHGVTAAARGVDGEIGITIWGTENVAIVCHHNALDVRDMEFQGWTQSKFHYCPSAKWDEWVKLARTIIAIDEQLPPRKPPK